MSQISEVAVVFTNDLFAELLTKIDEQDVELCKEHSHVNEDQTLLYFDSIKWYPNYQLTIQTMELVDKFPEKCKFIELYSGVVYQESGTLHDYFNLGYSLSMVFDTKE